MSQQKMIFAPFLVLLTNGSEIEFYDESFSAYVLDGCLIISRDSGATAEAFYAAGQWNCIMRFDSATRGV